MDAPTSNQARAAELLLRMSQEEKIGQLNQVNGAGGQVPADFAQAIRAGRIGSVINEVDRSTIDALQRIAVEESRLGIPLLIGRDVIHGFRTIFPIPLGQAAAWNPSLVERCAAVAAREAAAGGINWTFAPMMDISRDPRWGRIAETLGEDPTLASALAVAMVKGLQGEHLDDADRIAACAKHFAGYGAVESGRDYASANVPPNEMRNVHLRTFEAAVGAGVASVMTAFSDLDGVPATAHRYLLQTVLREAWAFDGVVLSDWDSVRQLAIHGFTENDRQSALAAFAAGVDVEMVGEALLHHLAGLIEAGDIQQARLDASVARVLQLKFRLGLFERPINDLTALPPPGDAAALATAKDAALESVVMLKDDGRTLPLAANELNRLAVIGPLADAPYEQLGTWVFDGDEALSVTPLEALKSMADGHFAIDFVAAMATSRSRSGPEFERAVAVAAQADAVVVFLGEESILSGEAHCRASIDLPGDQAELVHRLRGAGKPLIGVVLAGRPITLGPVLDHLDALLFAWHPGTMAGPAIAELLFGIESPSGKLPVTFPKMVGQIPIYHSMRNTGKPPSPESVVHIDDIDPRAPQTSIGMTAFHLDAGYEPEFEFGFGLSYAEFHYEHIRVNRDTIRMGESIKVSAQLSNRGDVEAVEVAQLYVRDLVGRITRPIKELKGFQRIRLAPGEATIVEFRLHTDDLAFYCHEGRFETDPGEFHVWIGGSANATLRSAFRVTAGPTVS